MPRIYPDLATYLRESGEKQADLARRLRDTHRVRITQAAISRYARGERLPRPALGFKIAAVCRLPTDSFARAYVANRRRASRDDARPKRKRRAA